MASKFFPLLVLRSRRIGAESNLISLSDGGGDASTQPFHPFLTGSRFLRGTGTRCCGCGDALESSWPWSSMSSSSPGVRGLLDDVRVVLDEMDGCGVDSGDRGIGGGVTDVGRWNVDSWMVGRVRQKDDVLENAG